jgi:D-alanyl-D-alanine carboxypeptidase
MDCGPLGCLIGILLAGGGLLSGPHAANSQCLGSPDPFAAQHSDPRYSVLQRAVDTYRSRRQQTDGFSGVSLHVSLSAHGPDFDIASGTTSRDDGRPICSDTLFQIGSITKSFTSVLLLQLEARGVLSIHDTLGKWLPQYTAWSSITIEQLLHMTAPTGDYVLSAAYQRDLGANIHRDFGPAQLISYVYRETAGSDPANSNSAWRYVNTNYILVSLIISKAAGMPYADVLRKQLLEPLDLRQTYYQPRVPPGPVLDRMASGYDEQSICRSLANTAPPCSQWPLDTLLGQDTKSVNLSDFGGAGGIVASLADVTRWIRALFGSALLAQRQRAELFSVVSRISGKPIVVVAPSDPQGFALGIGQDWLPRQGRPLWFYQGQTFGYEVLWGRLSGDDLVVVLAQNSSTSDNGLESLYSTVLDIIEPQKENDIANSSR